MEFLCKFSGTIGVNQEIVHGRVLILVHGIGKDLAISTHPCYMPSTAGIELFYNLINTIHLLNRDGIWGKTFQVWGGPTSRVGLLTDGKGRSN